MKRITNGKFIIGLLAYAVVVAVTLYAVQVASQNQSTAIPVTVTSLALIEPCGAR